jgi:hypothetical protein
MRCGGLAPIVPIAFGQGSELQTLTKEDFGSGQEDDGMAAKQVKKNAARWEPDLLTYVKVISWHG